MNPDIQKIIEDYVASILLYERKIRVHRELDHYFSLKLIHRVLSRLRYEFLFQTVL